MTEITDGFFQQLQQSMYEILIPNFLKIILPYVIVIVIFGVIRAIFFRVFRDQPGLKHCANIIIIIAFLAVVVFILSPITTHFISHSGNWGEVSIPEYSGSDPFSEISVPEFSGSDPFKIAS